MEIGDTQIDQAQLWLRGGFPDSLLASDDRESLLWRQDFIRDTGMTHVLLGLEGHFLVARASCRWCKLGRIYH